MTFHERKVRLFSAWSLTRGQFWGMVGSYLVAGLLALAVVLLATVVIAPLISVIADAGRGRGLNFFRASPSRPTCSRWPASSRWRRRSPWRTNALLMALTLAILAAPAPVIYLALQEAAAR